MAAAYALYSSATMLVVSVGSGTHGFTLDTAAGAFVCTHPHMRIPERGACVGRFAGPCACKGSSCMHAAGVERARIMHASCAGQIYSLNDARYFDWPPGLRRYIDAIRQGKGQHPKQYSARYICSLVADFHRCACRPDKLM